jgi:hypothetical protein
MGSSGRACRLNSHNPNSTPNTTFPNLTPANHRVIGPATDTYNCIAWACGDTKRWWQPGPKCHWPIACDPHDFTTDNLLAALTAVGFVACPDGLLESDFEKIAVYSLSAAEYTHVPRQLPSGLWTSKLGNWELIEHDTPEAVAGGVYGHIVQFMKRPSTMS